MKYLKNHSIIVLEDKDYENTTREDLMKLILSMNDQISWNEGKDLNLLIKADLTRLFKLYKDYIMDLYNDSYLFGFDPEEIDEQLNIICPHCFSNKFEAIKKAYLPIGIITDTYEIWEEDERELMWDDEIKILCCKCGNIYNIVKEE